MVETASQKYRRTKKFLTELASVIVDYEDLPGYGCTNNVGCHLMIDNCNYMYDGEKFVKIKRRDGK